MISLGLGLWSTTILSRLGFSPSALFANGEVGVWYDPSDLTTLFQDHTGTTPVTTPGQTVGLMLDKSGNDLHATQATTSWRPRYGIVPAGGRRNLLERTEQFDNAAWAKTELTVAADSSTAPDGETTADKVTPSTSNTNHFIRQSNPIVPDDVRTISVYAKAGGYDYLQIIGGTTNAAYANFELTGAGAVSASNNLTTSITSVGDGWYLCTATQVSEDTAAFGFQISVQSSSSAARAAAFAGDGTSGIFIWGAQLEASATATAYQKVTSPFDVTEAGVESLGYLSFDGIDDWMVTPTITPGIDKVQVFAGVRKLSDAAQAVITSFGNNTEDGSVETFAPRGTTTPFRFGTRSGGTVRTPAADASGSEFDAPITVVFTSLCSIPEDLITLRIDGTQVAQSTADQGTGNYLTYPMYLGRRGGTTFPLNGQVFSLITRFGANLEVAQIESTEAYVAGKTAGVTL